MLISVVCHGFLVSVFPINVLAVEIQESANESMTLTHPEDELQ